MYNKEKMIELYDPTVAELIKRLQELPEDAKVNCCGDEYMFIHIETDESVINIDSESLDDTYERGDE